MICHMGGFPTIRHNEIRDITASLLTEVCNNVATEPALQPLNGESMTARSANTDDGAGADIRARGFWNRSQDAFFDVRVFYTNASSNRSTNATSVYRRHEQAKKRELQTHYSVHCSLHLFLVLKKKWLSSAPGSAENGGGTEFTYAYSRSLA